MNARARTCAKTQPELTAFLAGELKPRRAAAVRAHLAGCAACRAEARELAAALDAAREALRATASAPAPLEPERLARIRAARRPAVLRFLLSPAVLARAAAAVLVLGVLTAVMVPAIGTSRRSASRIRADYAAVDAIHAEAAMDELGAFGLDSESVFSERLADHAAPRDRPPPPAREGRAPAPERAERQRLAEPELRGRPPAVAPRPPVPAAEAPDEALPGAPLPAPAAPRAEPAPMVGDTRPADWRGEVAGRGEALARRRLTAEPVPSARLGEETPGEPAADPADADAQVRAFLYARAAAPEPAPPGEAPSVDDRLSGLAGMRDETARIRIDSDEADRDAWADRLEGVAERAAPPEFNAFVETAREPFSTFAMDVDTASYAQTRAHILAGQRPPPTLVRTEEFLNAFDYDYTPPVEGAFAIDTRLLPSPFRPGLHVLKIGIKAQRVGRDQDRRAMLTLVIDTSGSMDTPDRLGRIRASIPQLVAALDPEDEVAIVQFDRRSRLLLEPTRAAERDRILAGIEAMAVGGGTNLEAGLTLGYQVAARNFRSGASNRVLLLTDGVANLGATTADELLEAIAAHRRQGIYLTVLGFGLGTYDDELLKTLAQRGDGAYAFIDSEAEAQRVLVDELAATLHTVANDAKIQVEFDPAQVVRYRQVGYERRQLAKEDFRDDSVDAGEVGSGQSVTALYELELREGPVERIGTVFVRYEDVETGRVVEQARAIGASDRVERFEHAPPRAQLAVAAAEFAEVLRGNPHTAGTELDDVLEQLRPIAEALPLDGRVQELLRLVDLTRRQAAW